MSMLRMKAGFYKVPYSPYWGRISSYEKGREYHGCREEYNFVKMERGSNIFLPIILRLLGRISSEENGKGTEISEKKKQDFEKMWLGKNIKL